jgi:hypothetical protein
LSVNVKFSFCVQSLKKAATPRQHGFFFDSAFQIAAVDMRYLALLLKPSLNPALTLG